MTTARTVPAGLTERYAAWDAPWTGDPFSDADSAARTAETKALAALILAAPLGTRLGAMTVVSGGWSAEQAALADQAKEPYGSPEWYAALGARDRVVLTGDGRSANYQQWCEQPDGPHGDWVRYTRWTAQGQVAHGFVCSRCRKLTQTG